MYVSVEDTQNQMRNECKHVTIKNNKPKKETTKRGKEGQKSIRKAENNMVIVFPAPSVTAPKSTGLNSLVKSNLAFLASGNGFHKIHC